MSPRQYSKNDSGLNQNYKSFGRFDDSNLHNINNMFNCDSDSKLSGIMVISSAHIMYSLGL